MWKNFGAETILYPFPYWVSAHMTNLRKNQEESVVRLKEKLLQTATTKVAKHIVNSGSVDNAINTAINKLGKLSGMKTTDEAIKNVSQKNYLIIKARSFSVSSIVGMFKDKTPNTNDLLGRFQIVDKDGILK